jgi:AcrR family transcriptional regulator
MLFERLIDRPMILEAALQMADQDGLRGLAMCPLATRLGVTPMSLYRHVPNRAALLNHLAELLLDEIVRGARPRETSQQLPALLGSIRSAARRHHHELFALLLRDHQETAATGIVRQAFLEALLARDVPVGDAIVLVPFISTVVLGWAAAERGGWDPFSTQEEADRAFRLVEGFVDGLVDERRRNVPTTGEGDSVRGGHSGPRGTGPPRSRLPGSKAV